MHSMYYACGTMMHVPKFKWTINTEHCFKMINKKKISINLNDGVVPQDNPQLSEPMVTKFHNAI